MGRLGGRLSGRFDGRFSPGIGSAATVSAAQTLAGDETDALAISFDDAFLYNTTGLYGSMYIVDTITPANDTDAAPGTKLTYTGASAKFVMGPKGLLGFGAHNLYLNSASPANQSVTVVSGATYAITLTGSVSITLSGAATGTITAGTTTFTAASATLTCGSTSGTGTVHLRRTPVHTDTYMATAGTAKCALPNEWGSDLTDGTATTQTVTVVGGTHYAVYYEGSGSITLSDAASDAVTASTPAHIKATSTSLTLTVSGSVAKLNVRESLGILPEEQRTQLCTYNCDLTNAAWVKTNATAAKTAAGPDGVANSASTLTATAGNATCLQSITSASAARITACYIKRRTGTGTVEMTQDNGTTWAAVTVTSGWTRVSIASATLANPVVGLRIVTSGDAVDVALFDHGLGSFLTSTIPNPTSSSVTRAADNISLATSAFPGLAWPCTLYGEVRYDRTPTTGGILSTGTGIFEIYTDSALRAAVYSGGATAGGASIAGAMAAGTIYRIAASFGTNDVRICRDGSAISTDSTASEPSSVSTLKFGLEPGGGYYTNGHLRRVLVPRRSMSSADMQTLTSTGALP